MAVLSVAEAREHLSLSPSAGVDEALGAVIDAAERAIAARCGDLEPTSRTAVVEAECGPLVVVRKPILELTSITSDSGTAQTLPTALTDAQKAAGVIPGNWYGTFTVVYVSGRSYAPVDLLMGIKELTAHLWATNQRSAADRRGREQQQQPGAAYVFPYRVEQWIAPYMQAGIA